MQIDPKLVRAVDDQTKALLETIQDLAHYNATGRIVAQGLARVERLCHAQTALLKAILEECP